MSEDELYEEAIATINETVEDVLDTLDDVARSHDYQLEWVIEEFRNRFNNNVRKVLR